MILVDALLLLRILCLLLIRILRLLLFLRMRSAMHTTGAISHNFSTPMGSTLSTMMWSARSLFLFPTSYVH